ncbi:MAG: EamA family transporter [Candidatus Thorarchaeota archaeon]
MSVDPSPSEELGDQPSETRASRRRLIAALQAIFVTVLWASSWVVITFGLEQENLPPLTYSGLRYSVAAVVLVVVILSKSEYRESTRSLSKRWWAILALYGVIFVSITQGSQFVGLFYLEAITVSILLNLTPIIVLLMGVMSLRETPSWDQTLLIIVGVLGAMLYFYPFNFVGESLLGIVIVLIGVFANSISSVLGRYINREKVAHPVVVTGVSMTIGASLLLSTGLLIEELPMISLVGIFYILWLALVNTAFAFTLWNRAMQTLRAVDMTLINSTMLPQIVLLSIFFLGEMPEFWDWIGLIILTISIAAVQVSQAMKENNRN